MNSPLRVLLIEDSPTDAKLIERELVRSGFSLESRRVDNAAALTEALAGSSWDVILCDWSMPTFSGMKALQLLKDSGLDIPFILVSGTVGEEAAVDAMRAGAKDFVLKDRMARLAPTVEREIRERRRRNEHREAEESLRVVTQRFSRLAESGIIGLCVGDLSGEISEANGAFLDLYGFTREDLDGGAVAWDAITSTSETPFIREVATQLTSLGFTLPRERELLRRDGSRVSVLLGAAMLDHPQVISFHVDLTDLIRAREALEHARSEIRQIQKMEAIGSLAGAVAHDFNNLLTVILSYSTLLAEECGSDDPFRLGLDEIHSAGTRAAALTRQLLAFSRKQVLQPRVVALNDVLASMQRMLRRLVPEDIEVIFLPSPDPGFVQVDPGQMEQVVTNLVVNARDAVGQNGRIVIETSNVEATGEEAGRQGMPLTPSVVLSVIDNGTGIDPELVDRIFEPFFTTKAEGVGTGLGLSTVFGIVSQSGGRIEVRNESPRGTRFDLYLPRVMEIAPFERENAPAVAEDLSGSETVLVVEDEAAVLELIALILRRRGYGVLEAGSAGDALLIAERHPGTIDLLLTDVVMPLMRGPRLAERLCALRPDIKVLFMSGYLGNVPVDDPDISPTALVVPKPITPDSLLQSVRLALDHWAD